eukprot:TRINITY_DN634_c0_g1_i1.p1 TRINITY_DN634_c0_g1~~TRINITY_DN634_c0_g1_i1.p1  ORF type:complete len:162 (+),score=35.69 TRINITY_DN634_c0_g1_i1:470-955(+)
MSNHPQLEILSTGNIFQISNKKRTRTEDSQSSKAHKRKPSDVVDDTDIVENNGERTVRTKIADKKWSVQMELSRIEEERVIAQSKQKTILSKIIQILHECEEREKEKKEARRESRDLLALEIPIQQESRDRVIDAVEVVQELDIVDIPAETFYFSSNLLKP